MLKFGHVGLDQNYAKFDRVDPKDASFRKFILNFFDKTLVQKGHSKTGYWIGYTKTDLKKRGGNL